MCQPVIYGPHDDADVARFPAGRISAESGRAAYKAIADPTDTSNPRYFATNVNGAIWENTTSLLGVMPEVGDPPVGHLLR